jgi:hypothetical protein
MFAWPVVAGLFAAGRQHKLKLGQSQLNPICAPCLPDARMKGELIVLP